MIGSVPGKLCHGFQRGKLVEIQGQITWHQDILLYGPILCLQLPLWFFCLNFVSASNFSHFSLLNIINNFLGPWTQFLLWEMCVNLGKFEGHMSFRVQFKCHFSGHLLWLLQIESLHYSESPCLTPNIPTLWSSLFWKQRKDFPSSSLSCFPIIKRYVYYMLFLLGKEGGVGLGQIEEFYLPCRQGRLTKLAIPDLPCSRALLE